MQGQLPSDSVTQHCRFDVLGYGYRLTQPTALTQRPCLKRLSMIAMPSTEENRASNNRVSVLENTRSHG